MTSAISLSLRVVPGAQSGGRTSRWLKSFGYAAGVVALAFVVVATAVAAAGRVLAVSRDAPVHTRSLVGLTSQSGLSWFVEPDTGMVPRSGPARTGSFAASSGTLEEPLPDEIHTGSIGAAASIFDAGDASLASRFASLAPREMATSAAPILPLPRIRPRLAALPPVEEPGVTFDGDAHSPRTAIYDITAKMVYMPNGQKLEAHSGFGSYMDNPKYVRLRMRGVTPPNTYKLTMREALFHGVEAIRLNPENKEAMFGRAGMLVHPYMLGPNGQSNGCISVKDYPKFLAAFKRGEVDRVIVVERLSKTPSFFARRNILSASAL